MDQWPCIGSFFGMKGLEPKRWQRTAIGGLVWVAILVSLAIAVAGCRGFGARAGQTVAEEEAGEPTGGAPDTLPAPPSNITPTAKEIFDILLGWNDNSDNEDGFRIYRRRLDIFEAPVGAGSTGEDEDEFLDQNVVCGATYEYTVASFNTAGESPALECWVVTLPPCPEVRLMRLAVGVEFGRNFLTGELGPQADFYLALGPDGQLMFMADLEGQLGLVDLGDMGATPLPEINLPSEPVWERDGVPAIPGHTYAALARDGKTIILFTIGQMGDPMVLEYILIWPSSEIVRVACPDMGGRTPGGPCISGDGVCDPTCVPDVGKVGQRVPADVLDQPDQFPQSDTGAPSTLAAAYPAGYGPDGIGQPAPGYDGPTYTEQDLDCTRQPCISGDGVCNPLCATDEEFANWQPTTGYTTASVGSIYVDRDCGQNPCVTGDGVCDPTCVPNPSDPGKQPDDDVVCYDRDQDGKIDGCTPVQTAAAAHVPAVYARAVTQSMAAPCQCQGDNLVCEDVTYDNYPSCNTTPTCSCDGSTLYCDDGTSYENHASCIGQGCICNGTTLQCGTEPPLDNHPACAGNGQTPDGGPSRLDGDCGGRCIEDGVCVPNCDPFWDPYDDPNSDDPGNDFVGAPALSYVPSNTYDNQVPTNAVDPDCEQPCTPDGDPCTCLPTNFTAAYDNQRYAQCLPDCKCEQTTYMCRDQAGNVVRTVENAQQCQTTCECQGDAFVCYDPFGKEVSRIENAQGCIPVCACEGADYICRGRFSQTVVSRSPNDQRCVGVTCSCRGADYVCLDAAGKEISRIANNQRCTQLQCSCYGTDYVCLDATGKEVSRTTNDTVNCACSCSGPDVYCGNSYARTSESECGCSCQGNNLSCPDGFYAENYSYCCRCECDRTGKNCFNSCTGQQCRP